MIKYTAVKLGLIKREIINKYTIVCDCCGKEAVLERKQPSYGSLGDSSTGMSPLMQAKSSSLQESINQLNNAQKSAMTMKPTKLHATASAGGYQSGFMQQVGEGEEILPNGWYTLNRIYNDRMPESKNVCCEECLVKFLDKGKEEAIEDYRKLQLNKLRK